MCCDYQSLEEIELEYKRLFKKERSKKEKIEEKLIVLTA
jgi:hypothetical protein